jgi:transposase
VSIWHMLTHQQPYRDLGADYHQRRDPQQTMRRIVQQANAIGLTVSFDPIEVAN